MTTYLGIDPGKSGAIISMTYTDTLKISVFTLKNTPEAIVNWLSQFDNNSTVCTIERVHAMPLWWGKSGDTLQNTDGKPKQGITSTFKFGESYGILKGILIALNIKRHEVLSRVWQKQMNCLSRGDKNITKQRAQELWPTCKITHAYADALLITEYGRLNIWNKT